MTGERFIWTSEAVAEGHPDKICDYIADSFLDAYLAQDFYSRVACEVLCKNNVVVLAGEITSEARIEPISTVQQAVREIGYTHPDAPFCADTLHVLQFFTKQTGELHRALQGTTRSHEDLKAGDQGIMVGYATDETPELMPLPILLANRLAQGLAQDRKSGAYSWLQPDAKTQVSILYENDVPKVVESVVLSIQHTPSVRPDTLQTYVAQNLVPRVCGAWYAPSTRLIINPSGSFTEGGPAVDCGVTGRKIVADTYGGAARHGGGAFSGKDPSKVDRSAAYFCRYVARQIIKEELAKRVEIQIAYAIGMEQPIAMAVDTFHTGNRKTVEAFLRQFDFRPAAIIERMDLLRPIYRQTTNYGHFGRPGLPWEE